MNNEVTHFVCTGDCGGMSPNPGTCQAEDCSKHDQPLTGCSCTDGTHGKEEGAPADEGGDGGGEM